MESCCKQLLLSFKEKLQLYTKLSCPSLTSKLCGKNNNSKTTPIRILRHAIKSLRTASNYLLLCAIQSVSRRDQPCGQMCQDSSSVDFINTSAQFRLQLSLICVRKHILNFCKCLNKTVLFPKGLFLIMRFLNYSYKL